MPGTTSLDSNEDSGRQPEWFDGEEEDRPLDEWMSVRAEETGRALNTNVLRQFEGNAKRCRSRLEFARQQLEEEPLEEFRAPIRQRIDLEARRLADLERQITTWRAKVG